MNRRFFLKCGLAASLTRPLWGALKMDRLDEAAVVLSKAVDSGQVAAAVLHVTQHGQSFTEHFGTARSPDAMFLLGSISKPICVTALMTLFDRGEFQLDDPLKKYLPEFTGDGRDVITIRQLLTHVSGLPDQLPENDQLRRSHAPLKEFVDHALRTPLLFAPGAKYHYASMGILLATHLIERLTTTDLRKYVEQAVFKPLGMTRSAQGLGAYSIGDFIPCQTEFAAPEAGAGDPTAKTWDWNSPYWRKLGVPWGGTHSSAPDIARWFDEFLLKKGTILKPETLQLMITNHNPAGFTPRGLGFGVGTGSACPGCSEKSFGHTGSTGTLAWADPATETICVVLTSLPGRAVMPHPREQVARLVAESMR